MKFLKSINEFIKTHPKRVGNIFFALGALYLIAMITEVFFYPLEYEGPYFFDRIGIVINGTNWTPYGLFIIGIIFRFAARQGKAQEQIKSNLNENEVQKFTDNLTLKHGFAKKESGILTLTNQRLIYKGIGKSLESILSDGISRKVKKGSRDFSIPIKDIVSCSASGMLKQNLTIKDKDDNEYKFFNAQAKKWIKEITEVKK